MKPIGKIHYWKSFIYSNKNAQKLCWTIYDFWQMCQFFRSCNQSILLWGNNTFIKSANLETSTKWKMSVFEQKPSFFFSSQKAIKTEMWKVFSFFNKLINFFKNHMLCLYSSNKMSFSLVAHLSIIRSKAISKSISHSLIKLVTKTNKLFFYLLEVISLIFIGLLYKSWVENCSWFNKRGRKLFGFFSILPSR